MCERYYRRSDKQQIAETFQVIGDPSDMILPAWNFNVAPKTFQPVIRNHKETGERKMVLMRWGHVPRSVKNRETVRNFPPLIPVPKASLAHAPGATRFNIADASSLLMASMNGCDLKVVPMIVRRGHTTGPAVPSAVP